ncbi:hypothetical protein ACFV5N_09930 [Streptomyces sp. NPDC059853]|uniref:hypothetical protein n=1 Tax=Streptomyces sp. NPDC059853 TaxID=3346973 RepID=UPI00365D443B
MMLWMRARRLWTLAAGGGLYLLAMTVLGDGGVVLPSLSAGSPPATPLALFLPLINCLVLLFCLGNRLLSAELTGVRSVWRYDLAMVSATAVLSVLLGYAMSELLGFGAAASTGRNLLFLCGLMLLARGFAGERGAGAVPVVWLILVTLFGYGDAFAPRPWTVVAMPPGDGLAWAASLLVFGAGLGMLARGGRSGPAYR